MIKRQDSDAAHLDEAGKRLRRAHQQPPPDGFEMACFPVPTVEGGKGDPHYESKLAWVRQLMEWQHDVADAREFVESLKVDVFHDQVFVFTPKGEVKDLPTGSTPVDFAYRIHTDIGHRCIGAKVNGRIVPLDHKLQSGDVVEIVTSRAARGPSRDWIGRVRTAGAREKIRQWFKRQERDENIVHGQELLDRELRR